MTDMVCDNCGRTGIRWMGPLSALTHTECPHCGGRNCQRAAHEGEDDEGVDDETIPPRVGAALACAASSKGWKDER